MFLVPGSNVTVRAGSGSGSGGGERDGERGEARGGERGLDSSLLGRQTNRLFAGGGGSRRAERTRWKVSMADGSDVAVFARTDGGREEDDGADGG